MAGIGFELERHFDKDTHTGDAVGLLGAGAVFAGPWAFGTAAIVALWLQARQTLASREEALLFALLTCACCMAMHITAPLTFVISRYLADHLYAGNARVVGPCYAGAWIIHLVVAAAAGSLLLLTDNLPASTALLGVAMIVAATHLWLAGAFVTMLRAYGTVAAVFCAGYVVAALLGREMGRRWGLDGYLIGFWCGIAGIAMTLSALLVGKLSFPTSIDLGFLAYAKRRQSFVLTGLALAVGTWCDKLIFWFMPGHGLPISNHLAYFPAYDVPAALGALSVLPGLSWLLLSVETGFAQNARRVYTTLRLRGTFDQIHEEKIRIAAGITRDFWGLMRIQAPITAVVLLFATDILGFLGLPPTSTHILRLNALAAVGQVLLQAEILYFLYFDAPGRSGVVAFAYMMLNLSLTLVSWAAGFWTYGLAPLVATWGAAWFGGWLLDGKIARLESDVLRHFARMALRPPGRITS